MIKAEPKSTNPLIHEFPDEPVSIKTARWFSNPLFAALGEQAEAAAEDKDGRVPEVDAISSDEDNEAENSDDEISVDGDDEDSQDEEKPKKKAKKGSKGLDANDVLASMPKTDKQIRHEKRLKALERNERRQVRKAKILGETEGEFDLAPAQDDEGSDSEDEKQLAGLSDEKKRKILEARALIKAGMGAVDDSATSNKFEVVEADRPLPSLDARKYDSDNEEYDSDDYARTMALGTMMLRRSKAKALVDASYNRFSWNDPTDLPEWFVDDENRHYRPQLPVPAALLEKMKEKMLALSTKPIAKVAEARARKNRNATSKLAAAKKKAQLVANSSEMSESMKLKSISKALRGADNKRPGKTYVVAKKGGGTKGGKGMKVVDKRLKNDKRALERSTKTKKNGKKGGLTGGKQRRHHK
jgi:AdoMet-dependent rRNA methyltransferase SPB1